VRRNCSGRDGERLASDDRDQRIDDKAADSASGYAHRETRSEREGELRRRLKGERTPLRIPLGWSGPGRVRHRRAPHEAAASRPQCHAASYSAQARARIVVGASQSAQLYEVDAVQPTVVQRKVF